MAQGAENVAQASTPGAKTYTLAECEQHTSHKDCWLIIDGKVYNVTEYLDEHPGGGEVMLSVAGKDATNDFEDVGHSIHARKLLTKYVLGDFAGGESSRPARKAVVVASNSNSGAALAKLLQVLLPFIVVLLAVLAFAIKPAAAK